VFIYAAIMIHNFIRSVAFIIALLLLPDIVPAQDYEIRLSHEPRVGDRYRFFARGSHTEVMSVFGAGKPMGHKANEYSIDLVSLMNVIDTDTSGRLTKYSLEIEKCLLTIAGTSKPLIAPGETLVATLEGSQYVFALKNVPLEAATATILGLVLPSHVADVKDDDVFGTRERKKVGENWPINGNLAAESLKESFKIETRRGGVKGSTTLEGTVRAGDNEYLIIGASIAVDDFSMPLPDGIKIHSGQLVGTFSGRFPVARGLPPLEKSSTIIGKFSAIRMADKNAPEMTFEGTIARKVQREMERAN
jgi:hypothetical protein